CHRRCPALFLPDLLLPNISQELPHLVANEPCGLKRALIDLCVEQGDQQREFRGRLCSVEKKIVDPNLVSTFQLPLVLQPEVVVGGCGPSCRGSLGPGSPQRQNGRHPHTLRLRAIKRKLCSSSEC
uniref:DNA damage-inducible transcript 4 protein n=1 Tax=Oncorhynchus tshawytscha TaxID=74940 RepID=A0AAZ3RM77_ONCTS